MKRLLSIEIAMMGLICSLDWGGATAAQVPEIPRRGLSGVAWVTTRNGQPVIYYNPATCRRMGSAACSFFRQHEYGHLALNHFGRNISVQQAEAEADAYAARTSSPTAVAAAQGWFSRGRGGSPKHGTPADRIARLNGAGAYVNARSSQAGRGKVGSGLASAGRLPANRITNRPSWRQVDSRNRMAATDQPFATRGRSWETRFRR